MAKKKKVKKSFKKDNKKDNITDLPIKKFHPKKLIVFIFFIIICQVAGFLGSLFNIKSIPTWFEALNKPAFNPPNSVFSPVWITLFVLMGVAAYLVWAKGWNKSKIALYVFAGQLVLNILWSALFFGLHTPLWAFVEIVILWLAILVTIILFHRISKPAAYLMIPYILWVTFAAVLNFALWRLNMGI